MQFNNIDNLAMAANIRTHIWNTLVPCRRDVDVSVKTETFIVTIALSL